MVWPGGSGRRLGKRLLTGLALACVLVLDSRAGEGPDREPPSDYALRHWGTDDGLPSHTITDIRQAPEGYLWMASTAGLIRFDGHRFTVFDQRNAGLTNPRIALLRLLEDGGIRVKGDDNSILESPSRAAPRFTALARPPQEGEFTPPADALPLSRAAARRKPDPGWAVGLIDRSGNVWLRAADGIEARLPDGSRIWSHTFPTGTTIAALSEDAEGNLWIGTLTDGLYRVRPVAFRVYGENAGIEETGVIDATPSDDGSVLLAGGRSSTFYRLRDGRASVAPNPDLSTYRDRRGGLWTLQDGRGPDNQRVVTVLSPRSAGGNQATFSVSKGFGPLHLFEPAVNSSDVVWGRNLVHVYRFEAAGGGEARAKPETRAEPIASAPDVRDALVDRSGAVWVASSRGLERVIAQAHADGTRSTDAGKTLFTVRDGLPTNQVRSLHEDRNGTLWIGTYGGGIVRMRDGRFEAIDESRGLAENVVNTILEDADGNFWMSGNRGVHRTPRVQLEAALDGRAARVDSILYGRSAGLTNPESSGHPGVVDRTGRYWFPTFQGLASVDPREALALESAPIHVLTEEVRSLPRAVSSDGAGGFRVPPGQSSLEIDYTAVTLRDPENVRFQYLLENYDSAWVEAGQRRTASFNRLPPGSYRFRVRAFVTPGRWIESDAPVSLQVMPAFHQTWWFRALLAIALIGAAFVVHSVRTGVLHRRAERLERTVAERTGELAREKETVARQVDQLQELERAKSRFFANVSHEFRTPLTLIQGPLEDLQQGLYGPLSEDVSEQVDVATRSSHRLLHLVDQLLDVARAESGRLSLRARRGDYRLFLRRVIGSLSPLAERKGVELTLESPDLALPLWFDPEHLEKVLLNVIGNALKFTPPGGHVRVTVREEHGDDSGGDGRADAGGDGKGSRAGWLVTDVTDDGPGIPVEDLPLIFDRFHRGGQAGRAQPGAGIGLALARELASLHSGTITATSREGQGSTFTIRLPRGRAHLADSDLAPQDEADLLRPIGPRDAVAADGRVGAAQAAEIKPDSAAALTADRIPDSAAAPPAGSALDTDVTTVLVADDNEEVRRYVRNHLGRTWRVLEASDGRQALALARSALPDLVVSDVMMPLLDGMAFCRALKSDPEIDFIPVILLTARASTDSRIEGLDEGADDYLTKPFNVRELEARIRNLIASRRRLRIRFGGEAGDRGGEAGVDAFAALPPAPLAIAPGTVKLESADAAFLEHVRAAVKAHLGDEDFDSDALARAVGASRATLYRRLRDLLGQSPMSLIRRVRLEQAAGLLARGEGAIGEIAYAVGFRSVAHFSATFKEQYGATPSAYRQARADGRAPES